MHQFLDVVGRQKASTVVVVFDDQGRLVDTARMAISEVKEEQSARGDAKK